MNEKDKTDSSTLAMSRTTVMKGVKKKRISYLDIKRVDQKAHTFKLPDTTDTVLGRTNDNLITLPFPNVSRHHSRIFKSNEDYLIEDLGSTNGTYVNGIKIAKCVLRTNDIIQVGDTRMVYFEREEICQS